MFGSEQLMYNTGGGSFYDYPISGSLRMEDNRGSRIYRGIQSGANPQKYTVSTWVKVNTAGRNLHLFGCYDSGYNLMHCNILYR